MNPVIVIPTFVSPRRRKDSGSVIATYDHTTPLSNPGELPRLLTSLQKVRGIGQIIVLAYLDAYTKLVSQLGGLPDNAAEAAPQAKP